MPCKIQIKENITRTIEDRTESGFNKPLAVAQAMARGVNVEFGTTVVKFVQRDVDFIDRVIEVPSSLVDQYYYNELAIEENEARNFQQEDAERAGENYSDDYLFLQQGGGVTKPGVEEVFNSVPELASIGTPEQYSQYLDTIFPNSEVKDVVYHGTGESTKIESFKARDGRIYFSDNLTASQYANWDEFNRAQDDPFSNPKAQVVPAIINLENAVTLDGVDFKETETNKEGDGIIGLNVKDPLGGIETQYVVRDASQVHVLGSNKDVQDFKKFVESSTPKLKASTSSQQTIQKVKQIAEQMGVDIQELSTYAKNNPEVDVTDVNGLADLLGKVIAIAEGKEDVALTEEIVHIATAMIEQVEPKLITELISKIDKFKIYKQVLAEYSTNPKYQTKDGKPDIRKIKKEAVDKLISELIIKQSEGSTEFPELTEEINRSMVRKFWNMILDWFTGQYRKSNIELFETVANKISEGNFEIVDDLGGGVFLQVSGKKELTDAQKELQQKIQTTKEQIFKRTNENEQVDPILLDTEEASNFYEVRQPDGTFEKVTKRVTDRVKAWYKKRFGNKEFSEAQKEFNELKRDLGVKFHYFFEDVHARYFNADGTRRETVGKRNLKLNVLDDAAYDKIENYFVNLVEEFSKDGKNPLVFSEVVVYDPKEKEAGTIDLLIVDENGKANIFDWKFMSISESATDVPWFKQGAFGIQLGRYKDILRDAYGVKEIGMNRAIPILMEFRKTNPKDKDSKLQIKGINVGSVDVSEIEDLRLVPVSEETESTGDKRLDKLLKELNAIYRQIGSKTATSDEEREFKRERMNLLKQAIRSAQSSKDISPMIDVIKVMRREGEQIINDWETIYSKRPASDKDFENSELSDYADNIREYIAISQVFSKIDDLIGNLIYNKEMEQDAVTKEQKEEIAFRKSILDEIRDEKSKISNSRDEVVEIAGEFADKFMGERNLVKGLLTPQAVWKNLSSYFRGASESPLASVQVLFKLVTNARGNASADANNLIDELLNIRKTLADRGGNLRDIVQKIYQKDSDNKIVNKLIYKYKKEFYSSVDDNAIEGKQDKSWLLKNINVDEYKKEALEMMNKRIKSINNLYSENETLRDELILEERRKWDISRLDFNGWNNYIIKRHPSDNWLSEEYKELQNDPELLKLYNFISSVNDQATDVGYIQNKIHSTFLPFVRKSMAESIAWDFSLSTIMNFGKSLELNADDVGYGSINELTNELEHSIPKYYTYDFTKKENGEVDYTDVSEDLFKNMILYINHMQKYKYLSEVEGQLNLVKTVEGFKSHYETTRGGDIVMENGKPKEASGNVDNQKIFDDFLRALLYEEKYPLSSADTGLNVSVTNFMKKAINKVANKEVFPVEENPSAKSLVKVMDATNRAFQLKTLGFEIISGAVNAFGGNIQVATQAGNYFKAREVLKNEADLLANRFKSEDEREMFIQLINTFMPLKDDPSYDKLNKAGMSKLTRGNFSDMLMVFMRYPEQHIEKSLFKTLLDNTMVVDGKLVNIREYVKNKYKDRYSSAEAYKDSKSKIEDEIQELKETSSISSTKKLEDGKLVIPGFDLNNRDEIQNLTNLTRRIARNATGGVADADLNRMQMSIWTKSMMVFKNWIPKLVDTRFGEFRKISDDFSVEIDENGMTTGEKYDVGRVRLLLPFISFNIVKTIKEINDVISVTDAGISKLDALYNKYAEDYKNKTGQDLNMSKEDFNDLIITNLRNQIKELGILLSLFGAAFALGVISPDDDDDDKATRNAHRYAQRVVDKFIGELSFFYNPLEVQKLLSGSAFPAIGLFSDVTRFVSHTSMEWTGIDVSDFDKSPEEVREKAQPIKNLGKMFPLTKSLITYLAIFDSDFAKEYDVTIQKESNK
jgi:transcriptional regulator with XRE-family HTH domain